jgi:uncharacterized membrane protein YbhN (UPF0104 family)
MTILVLASGGILAADLIHAPSAELRLLCKTILLTTPLVLIGATLLLCVSALSGPAISDFAGRVPIAGTTLARLFGTVRAFREQKNLLAIAAASSVVSNLVYITSFFLVANGLPMSHPTWVEHLVVVPVASLVGAIPATPAGLGTMELAVNELYKIMPGAAGVQPGDGAVVTLAHRVTMMVVALAGLIYYLNHRAEVREVYAEAEALVDVGA